MTTIFSPALPADNYTRCYWTDTVGCARSLALCNAAANADGPILLVCEDSETVEQSIRELKYFSKNKGFGVFSLPDWETLPYDNFSPHQDIVSERLSALHHLPKLERGILVASISSLMHRLPPQQYITANSLDLRVGQKLQLDEIRREMVMAGYQSVDSVYEHGEFAIRGSIIDIYPMGSTLPYRIDLFDDQIDTLRIFDPETQRSDEQVNEIRLLPGREFPLDKNGIAIFRNKFHELFDIDVRQCPLYQDVSEGISSPGLEYYLAVFFEQLDSLFDFLPPATTIYKLGNLKRAGDSFWGDIQSRFADRQIDRFCPILDPDAIFIRIDAVLTRFKDYPQIESKDHKEAVSIGSVALPDLASNARLQKPFAAVEKFLNQHEDRVLFCAESAGRQETLLEVLKHIGIEARPVAHWEDFLTSEFSPCISIAPLDQGMWMPEERLVLRAQAGDTTAFDSLLRRYEKPLFRHAFRMIGDVDGSYDALQESYVAIFRSIRNLRSRKSFRAWAYGVTTRTCLKHLARRGRLRDRTSALDFDPTDTVPSVDLLTAEKEEAVQILDQVAGLSPKLRAVMVLHYQEGLTLAEVAAALEISAGTVKSRLAAGLARLRVPATGANS